MRELQFVKVLRDLENTKIGLFLSNHQFMQGELLAVQQDHLVLDVNENVHYIPLQHIKALSKNTKEYRNTPQIVPYLDRQYFTELLDVFKYSWCTINGPEKEAHVGVVSNVAEDHLMLITHAELLYIPTSCITNIYSEIPQHQILLANQNKPVPTQETHPAPVVVEAKIESQLPEVIQDAVIQLEHEPKSFEFLLKKEPLQLEESKELQTVGHVKQDQLEVVQQLETVESQVLFNKEEVEKVEDSSPQHGEAKEVPSNVIEETPVVQNEETLVDSQDVTVVQEELLVVLEETPVVIDEKLTVVMEETPDFQNEETLVDSQELPVVPEEPLVVLKEKPVGIDQKIIVVLEESPDFHNDEFLVDSQELPVVQEELLVEVLGLESMQMEEPLEIEPVEISLHARDVPEAVVEDEEDEDSSEFDDWGVLESVFGTRKVTVDMLSFSDPLGYEREFPLSSWSTSQKEKDTAPTRNKEAKKKEISIRNDHSIKLRDTHKPTDLLNSPIRELHETKEAETADQAEFIVEEARPAPKTHSSITIITLSRQDEKAMLEEQYFSLAKHAANYSQRLAEHFEGSASTVQPSTADNIRRKDPVDGSPIRKAGIDEQYISLMNHAAKMYQQLLDK